MIDEEKENDEFIDFCKYAKGDYVVEINQNTIIDSKYWLFQSLRPLIDNEATGTIIFKNINVREICFYYYELTCRLKEFVDYFFLYLPHDRNTIQYLNSTIIHDGIAVIKKNKYNNK